MNGWRSIIHKLVTLGVFNSPSKTPIQAARSAIFEEAVAYISLDNASN